MSERPRPKILMTRNDHRGINSASSIGPEFGDDVPFGDTLSNAELADRYAKEVAGMKSLLNSPLPDAEKRDVFGGFFEPWPETLGYYRKRGIDTAEGEALLPRTNPELQQPEK